VLLKEVTKHFKEEHGMILNDKSRDVIEIWAIGSWSNFHVAQQQDFSNPT
jgi:hypothetical protein